MKMTGDQLKLQVFNDVAQLPSVRQAVEKFGARHKLPTNCLFGLKLALCELLANTISYGYEDQATHSINISMCLRNGLVRLEIVDDGIAFDPTREKAPSEKHALKDLPTGGYGIHLTKNFVDSMDYRRKNGRNHTVVTKKIRDS
jgi:anti-sigma regulatory factor (Ser/Thr protein kinase)